MISNPQVIQNAPICAIPRYTITALSVPLPSFTMIKNDEISVISSHKTAKQNTLSALMTKSIDKMKVLNKHAKTPIFAFPIYSSA